MHSWCSKRKGLLYLVRSLHLFPFQAADAALPTLDEFVAGMHWATYRASKTKILKSNNHSTHVFIKSSFASSRIMAS